MPFVVVENIVRSESLGMGAFAPRRGGTNELFLLFLGYFDHGDGPAVVSRFFFPARVRRERVFLFRILSLCWLCGTLSSNHCASPLRRVLVLRYLGAEARRRPMPCKPHRSAMARAFWTCVHGIFAQFRTPCCSPTALRFIAYGWRDDALLASRQRGSWLLLVQARWHRTHDDYLDTQVRLVRDILRRIEKADRSRQCKHYRVGGRHHAFIVCGCRDWANVTSPARTDGADQRHGCPRPGVCRSSARSTNSLNIVARGRRVSFFRDWDNLPILDRKTCRALCSRRWSQACDFF